MTFGGGETALGPAIFERIRAIRLQALAGLAEQTRSTSLRARRGVICGRSRSRRSVRQGGRT